MVHQLDDITYPRLNLNDHTLDDNLPAPKSQPQIECLRLPPKASLGALDILPLELLQEILIQLDVRTFIDFRRVNRRAIELVNSLPEYRAIHKHALNALRGILSIKTGGWITCRTLYEKLCTPTCEHCGDFSSYLYLLTCKRVCFLCFSEDKRYLPLSPRRASGRFGLDSRVANTLPRMRVVRGIYSPNEKRVRGPAVLVDHEAALQAGIALHGSFSAMLEHAAEKQAQKVEAYNTKVAAAVQHTGSTARRMRPPSSSDPFDGKSGNPFRFVAIVSVPWFDRSLQEVEWGFHCEGCKKACQPPLHWRRKFTAALFDEHLRQFGNIQDSKHYFG